MLIWREREHFVEQALLACPKLLIEIQIEMALEWRARPYFHICRWLMGLCSHGGGAEHARHYNELHFVVGDFQNQIRQAAADYNCRKVNTKGKRDGLMWAE